MNSAKRLNHDIFQDRSENENIKRQKIVADIDNIPSCLKGEAPQIRSKGPADFKMESDRELDDHKIHMRLKQISYGKNTGGYDNYIAKVPRNARRGYNDHPRTPDPYEKQSKRTFDGRIKAWRRALHKWDISNSETDNVKDNNNINTNTNDDNNGYDDNNNDDKSDDIHIDNTGHSAMAVDDTIFEYSLNFPPLLPKNDISLKPTSFDNLIITNNNTVNKDNTGVHTIAVKEHQKRDNNVKYNESTSIVVSSDIINDNSHSEYPPDNITSNIIPNDAKYDNNVVENKNEDSDDDDVL